MLNIQLEETREDDRASLPQTHLQRREHRPDPAQLTSFKLAPGQGDASSADMSTSIRLTFNVPDPCVVAEGRLKS